MRIYFQLSILTGDNLGLNGISGFVQTFSRATYCCRFCSANRAERSSMVVENSNLLRKVDNYEQNGARRKSSKTGITRRCVYNDVLNFHILRQCAADVMHDLFEGVVQN